MSNPFTDAEKTAAEKVEAGKSNVCVVTGTSNDGTLVMVEPRDEETSGSFPARVPEDTPTPPENSVVLVSEAKGERSYVETTVSSPDGSTSPVTEKSASGLTKIGEFSLSRKPAQGIFTAAQRSSYASGADDSYIYIAGGVDENNNTITTLYRFDPSNESMTTLTSMPAHRRDFDGAVIDGVFYTIGGLDGSANVTDTVYAYDISADSWSTVSSLPVTIRETGVGVFDGKLYSIGGRDGNNNMLPDVYRYDPSTDSWTTLSNFPVSTILCGLTVYNSELVVVADDTSDDSTEVVVYDEANDSWNTSKYSASLGGGGIGSSSFDRWESFVSRGKLHAYIRRFGLIYTYYADMDGWKSHADVANRDYGNLETVGNYHYPLYGNDYGGISKYRYPETLHTAESGLHATEGRKIINTRTSAESVFGSSILFLDGDGVTTFDTDTFTLYRQE